MVYIFRYNVLSSISTVAINYNVFRDLHSSDIYNTNIVSSITDTL